MSARTKVIPYVVEVDKLGYAIAIPTALTASSTPSTVERMKRYEIAAVIRNARSVTTDPVVDSCNRSSRPCAAPLSPRSVHQT
jgi:type IV secretory pathway TrbF-like protein